MKEFDVIIVGAGPAGIFAALEMAETGLKVLILEKGRDIGSRACPIHTHAANAFIATLAEYSAAGAAPGLTATGN